MTRRDALRTMAAGVLATFIHPAPRRQIDLMKFVDPDGDFKYDFRLPWNVGDWTYATDSKVCVRVRPESGDKAEVTKKMPPFDAVQWNHDELRGWKTLPKLEPIVGNVCTDDTRLYVVKLGDSYFDAELYQKTLDLGAEYVPPIPWVNHYQMSHPLGMRFRFDEGVGLLMPMDPVCTARDIEAAKKWF